LSLFDLSKFAYLVEAMPRRSSVIYLLLASLCLCSSPAGVYFRSAIAGQIPDRPVDQPFCETEEEKEESKTELEEIVDLFSSVDSIVKQDALAYLDRGELAAHAPLAVAHGPSCPRAPPIS